MSYPWVQKRIKDVDHQIHHHKYGGNDQDRCLDDREIPRKNGAYQEPSCPRPGKNSLDDDRTVDEQRNLKTQDGNHRYERVPQGMFEDDNPFIESFRPRGTHKIL